jgi:hypothetical protein
MKNKLRIYVLGCFLLKLTGTSAQSEPKSKLSQQINGFGKLQIGMSINELPELKNAYQITSSEDYYKYAIHNKSSASYEIVCDTNEAYPQGEYDPRVRMFQIGKLDLTENITVSDITLKFYKNKLYFIEVSDSKMEDLLKLKYGEGSLDVKKEDHTFQNGYGTTFIKTDQTFTRKWLVDKPNVNCEYVLMSWYNDQGEQNIIAYALLTDNTFNKEIEIANNEIKDRIKERIKAKKKSDLNGF